MSRPIGRPLKYKQLLEMLEEDVLYTPATIAALAESSGYIAAHCSNDVTLEKQRIRIALGRYSNNHKYPDEGDGTITLKGQSPTPAWFGWRWQDALY